MNFRSLICAALGILMLFTGCNVTECLNDDTAHVGEYVRLSLSCDDGSEATRVIWEDPNGSGNLKFKWEAVDVNSADVNKLSFVVSNGESALPTRESASGAPHETTLSHSGLAVTPREGDNNRADFQTSRYYSQTDLNNALYCCAIAGGATITEDTENRKHLYGLEMPGVFTQTTDQDPSFLRDYMYMHASTEYNTNGTSLRFSHIPATIRYIITNSTNSAIQIEEVSLNVSGTPSPVAAQSCELEFDWTTGETALSFSEEGYDKVSTSVSASAVAAGKVFTAYTMVLPLADDTAFKGKVLNFNIINNGKERIAYQLKSEKLAKANGSEIYNWVGGKSYTIRINIGANAEISGEILADNSIKVSSSVSGSLTLRYEDSNGKALSDYAEICTLSIDNLAYYEDFISSNCAPSEAAAIGVYSSSTRIGAFPVPESLKGSAEDPLYSFGMLSDIHLNKNSSSASIEDFNRALTFLKDEGVALTCISGDISDNGTESEFTLYQTAIKEHDITSPVYPTTGNHDATYNGLNNTLWEKYTGNSRTYEVSKTLPDGSADHFLLLGMEKWSLGSRGNPYKTEDLTWLASKIEEYNNKKERCYIITHLFFPDYAGNLNGIYYNGNWLGGSQLNTLQGLADNYMNTIWFSGHSHWKWYLQKYQDRANVHRNYNGVVPSGGWSVHIPSCARPRDSNGTTLVDKHAESEGAIVKVYKDHIEVLGIDFISGKYLPIGLYSLDTSLN